MRSSRRFATPLKNVKIDLRNFPRTARVGSWPQRFLDNISSPPRIRICVNAFTVHLATAATSLLGSDTECIFIPVYRGYRTRKVVKLLRIHRQASAITIQRGRCVANTILGSRIDGNCHGFKAYPNRKSQLNLSF